MGSRDGSTLTAISFTPEISSASAGSMRKGDAPAGRINSNNNNQKLQFTIIIKRLQMGDFFFYSLHNSNTLILGY
jgi:hypothetical protein